jgi:hypothetical protein
MLFFEKEGTRVLQSLESDVSTTTHDNNSVRLEMTTAVKTLELATSNLLTQARETFAALRSDMGILENRRSISEAEAVTKLTELAFTFVALTSTASNSSISVYGIQNVYTRGLFWPRQWPYYRSRIVCA